MDNQLYLDYKIFDKYEKIKLNNGLNINLFQKKDLNKKIIMLIVNTGSYYSKIDGLAHLMEHYISNNYNKIIKKNNINIPFNFNTEQILTRYLFSYSNNNLTKDISFKKILEIICNSFIINNFDDEIINIEKERIDIEYNLNYINNVNNLLFENFIDDYNNKHGCGNKKYFSIKNLKQELIDFYNFFYNSNFMELYIIDNKPLNLTKQYIKCFEQIKPFNKDLNKNSKFYINLYNKSFSNYSSIFKNNIFKININNSKSINLIYSINDKYFNLSCFSFL